jgi:hypothetical protein
MGRRHLSWKEEHRVSEYQYYEFRALDRRLTPDQQQRLRSLSTRAEISATRFANEYSFGNFRGDPGRLLEEYFDAYLYAANWGTRELAFRLPRGLLDAETARRYCDEEDRAWVTETAEHVIVRFRRDDDEGDDWIEGDGLLDPLLDARSELAAGDLRLLYLGWLLKVQLGGLDDEDDADFEDDGEGLADEVEPPVPAGLRQLSDSLASVAKFLGIDDDLIAVAAKASGPSRKSPMTGSRTGSRHCRPARRTSTSRWSPKAKGRRWRPCWCSGSGGRPGQRAARGPVRSGPRASCWRARRPGGPHGRQRRLGHGRKHGHAGRRSKPPPTSAT